MLVKRTFTHIITCRYYRRLGRPLDKRGVNNNEEVNSLKRAKKRDVNIHLFSGNRVNVNINFNGKSETGTVIVYAIVIALVAKLLAMPSSDYNTLIQAISSLLSALGC